MSGCIFCQIIGGEIPSYKIYEDDDFFAFLDIFPKTEGHTLVIPKKHVEWVWDYPEVGRYFDVVAKIARHMRRVSSQEVVRSLIYGVDVPHAHVHLFPGIKDNLSGNRQSSEKMAELAKKWQIDSL